MIIGGIRGIDFTNGRSGVTIYLPDGVIKNIDATLVKTSKNMKAFDGTAISGRTEFAFVTQSIFTGSMFDGTGDVYQKLKDNTYKCINYDKSGVENK